MQCHKAKDQVLLRIAKCFMNINGKMPRNGGKFVAAQNLFYKSLIVYEVNKANAGRSSLSTVYYCSVDHVAKSDVNG